MLAERIWTFLVAFSFCWPKHSLACGHITLGPASSHMASLSLSLLLCETDLCSPISKVFLLKLSLTLKLCNSTFSSHSYLSSFVSPHRAVTSGFKEICYIQCQTEAKIIETKESYSLNTTCLIFLVKMSREWSHLCSHHGTISWRWQWSFPSM